MAEELIIAFTHKEIAEALVLRHGIHKGIWGVYVEFGIGAANVGSGPDDILPSAIVPVLKIGLQRFPELNALSVDAAKVNPGAAVKAGAAERSRSKKQA
jgi:hypothetical protein